MKSTQAWQTSKIEKLSDLLTDLRAEAGVSLTMLSAKSGIEESMLQGLEKGMKFAKRDTIICIGCVLGEVETINQLLIAARYLPLRGLTFLNERPKKDLKNDVKLSQIDPVSNQNLGELIENSRQECKLSLRQLSARSGISIAMLHSIIKGRKTPARDTVICIGCVLTNVAGINQLLIAANYSPLRNMNPKPIVAKA